MSSEKIKAEIRTEFGKGAARRIRREGKIPAVLYGHGSDPVHLSLPGHDTQLALKHGGANALLELEVEGSDNQLALTKQVQASPILRIIEHVDFVAVRRGEKVHVDVPIVVVGDAVPDTVVVTEAQVVELEAEATHIPESIEVSVQDAEVGTQIHASDLVLPAGSTLLTDPEALIVHVTIAREEPEPEAEAAEGEEGEEAEAAEGEADEADEGGDGE